MKIIYISALVSEKRVNDEFQRTGKNPGFAVQKFSRLLVKGMLKNGATVSTLSKNINNSKWFVPSTNEIEEGIKYKYIPCFNFPLIKHICLFLYTFIYVFIWGIGKRKDKRIICDVLSISTCMGALVASKLNRVQCVAVITDIFSLMSKKNNNNKSLRVSVASKLNTLYSSSFDKYILLTEHMNNIVNPKGHPYIVMEALCDSSQIPELNEEITKETPRIVMYAGGIYEVYGLKMLAEGFLKADVKDAKLVYYGSGPYVEEYRMLCAKHSNLEYRGVASNDEVVATELTASLLVNPRFSTEEYTRYSFPSKNIEYMASGTPLLTTNLPGMPEEYHSYVYLFENESVDGYAQAIKDVLSLPASKLSELGINAKKFVLTNKNNIVQARKVLKFLNMD